MSTYVPYSETAYMIFDSYTDRQFGAVLKRHQLVVALFINMSADGVHAYIDEFSKLPTIFLEDVKFCALQSDKAKRLTRQYATYLPQVSFFVSGELSYSIPFPSTEVELLAAVDVFLRPTLPTFNDKQQVYSAFGETAYTLISPPALVSKGRDYVVSVADNVGSFNVIAATPETLKSMGYSGEKICIYRKSDKVIKEVKDHKEFLAATRPSFYPKFDMELLKNIEGFVGLLCVEESATKEQKEKLADLGTKYDNLTFGIINNEELDDVHIMTKGKTRQFPCFLLLSMEYYVYFPVKPFDANIEQYVSDCANKRIDVIYPSEEVPTKQDDPYAIKVVGSNYEEFVTDKNCDVVMFYIGSDKDGLRSAHKIAKYVKKNNIQDIKVGYIITTLNSCKDHFPRLVFQPQINIFPKNDKSPDYLLYSAPTVYGILEGITKFSNSNITVNASTFRFSLELKYMVDLLQDLDELLPADRASAEEYILQRGQTLGFGNNLDIVINAIYNAAGGLVAGYDDSRFISEFEHDSDEFVEPDVEEELVRQTYPERHPHRGQRSSHHRRHSRYN